ncbi:MAG TPA: hypothetical protein VGM88_08060 [Kofleriaceae bacterium]|jgi:hypothetical protein
MRNVLTRASAAIDRGVVRWMERRMAPRRGPKREGERERLLELARFYGDATTEEFFPGPTVPRVSSAPVGDGPHGTHVADLAFGSEYEPFHPDARDAHLRASENRTVHARHWTSREARPTIVLLHGWGGGNQWITERTFAVAYWLKHGFDVAAAVLPYHGPRAAPHAGPGQWPGANPIRTNEGFGQAIFELRALAMHLRARGATAVGALGMSLGGYTTALWASVAGPDDAGGLDFAVAMIPAVDFARLYWQHGEQHPLRMRAARDGITEDMLADAFRVHAPTTRPARLPRERLAVVGGRGDRITGPDQAETLAAHWGVNVQWFEGGHLAQVGRSDSLRAVRRQLGALALPGRTYRG